MRHSVAHHGLHPGQRGVRGSAMFCALVLVGVMGAGYVRSALAQGSHAAKAGQPAVGGATRILFESPTSGMEREFVAGLSSEARQAVTVSDVAAAAGRGLTVRETPALLQLDASGRETGRWVGPAKIKAELAAVAPTKCVRQHTPRLRWVDEDDPAARSIYRHFQRGEVPDIYKAMSLRPELMEKVRALCDREHFEDGYLTRRTKERIATLVSALNKSSYCTGSHSEGLRSLGSSTLEVAALKKGDLDGASLSEKDRALLRFARRLTLQPGEIRDEDVTQLRAAGWRDEQIFEAAFDTSLFSFFNRMAATYGLEDGPEKMQP